MPDSGSWHGFDFAQRWVADHEVIAPSLPGWGASADAPHGFLVNDRSVLDESPEALGAVTEFLR